MAKRSQWKKVAAERAQLSLSSAAALRTASALVSAWRSWLPQVLLIAVATFWIYWPALGGGFIWDDTWYISENPLLGSASGLWKFWFQPGSWVEYYPIEETVVWLQWHLWGNNTLGYHLTDVFLHVINALLVWKLLSKFGLKLAWLGGLIFAIHPVQVESVAYICELKSTLSLPFFLLSMCAWIDYEKSGTKSDYQKSLVFFIVAMLCKISMAPFAAVILLYAWWLRGRIGWRDVKACAPFLLIAMALGYLTVWCGEIYEKTGHGVIPGTPLSGLLSRIDAVGLNATVYFARCFLPVDILLVYPQWPLHPHALLDYLPWFVFAGVAYVAWTRRRTWGRHTILGLGFFLLMLSPFLGFVAVSYMNFIWVMDHLLYISIIGLIGPVVAALEDIDRRMPALFAPLRIGAFVLLCAPMLWVSHGFAGLFKSEETMWTYVLQRDPGIWLAHDDLACNLISQERYPEALVQVKQAIALHPDYWDGYYNLGVILDKTGHLDEARDQYHQAMKLNSQSPKIYLNLGENLKQSGDVAGAEDLFRQGLAIAPNDSSLLADLAEILFKGGRVPEAIDLYRQAVEISPEVAQFQYDLGNVLLQARSYSEAVTYLTAAAEIDPQMASAHENLGVALAQTGQIPAAIEQFEATLAIDPKRPGVRDNLARALAQEGRVSDAIQQFQLAVQDDPSDTNAQQNLAALQQLVLRQSQSGK